MKSWVAQVRKGVVELIVLAALAEGEAYGYQLLQRINRTETLSMTESTVYPLLARLTREGYLQVRASPSPSGPPRRYYRMTRLGRSRLREMTDHWRDVTGAVNKLLAGGQP